MSEDYDVLSMSENDDYMDTDASIDDADGTRANDGATLSEADTSDLLAQHLLPSDDESRSSSGAEDSASECSAPGNAAGLRKDHESTPHASVIDFNSIDQADTPSMYRLPRMSAEPLSTLNLASEDADDHEDAHASPGRDWGLSYLDCKKLKRGSSALVIAVFGLREVLALQVIHKLLPNMPQARFLWVRTHSMHDLLASEYDAASKLFNHDPVLPTRRSISSRAMKLINIFTYDTAASGGRDKDMSCESDAAQEPTGKLWLDCPAAPVIPVTTSFLGTNELNEKARILSSLDAPLLRSPEAVYTPLTIDYLDMLTVDMLMSMNPHSTIACMTTPSKATLPALWPASPLPATYEDEQQRNVFQIFPTWLPVILKMSAFILLAFLVSAKVYGLRSSRPGAHDLQVWQAKKHSESWLYRLFFGQTEDVDSTGVSTVVTKSGAALVAYVNYVGREFSRLLIRIVRYLKVYGSQGRTMVNAALDSRVAHDTRDYARSVKNDLETTGKQLWNSVDAEAQLSKAGEFGQHASQNLAKLYSKARNSDAAADTVDFAKHAWAKCAQAFRH